MACATDKVAPLLIGRYDLPPKWGLSAGVQLSRTELLKGLRKYDTLNYTFESNIAANYL